MSYIEQLAEYERLTSTTKAAPEQAPEGASLDVDAELARLAALDPVAYERARKQASERLGIRAQILDQLVRAKRTDANGAAGNGTVMTLEPPEPWPAPVAGAWLLDELAAAVRRYVVLADAAADAVALWVVHAHCHDAATISPILAIVSAEKRSGKTTLLDLLQQLTPKPMPGANVTAPALFRAMEKWRPTLLLDEVETFLSPENDELRGVLNSGHRRATAGVIRCVGDDHEPRRFATWAPKALALIGRLPATLTDRSIQVALKRKRPDETVERLRLGNLPPLLDELARKAARWAVDHLAALAAADPATPSGLHDRARDNWEPLLAIADRAGGGWGERGRRAAVALSGDGAVEDRSIGSMLLADIREIFDAEPSVEIVSDEEGQITRRIRSADLASALARMEGRPWVEWGRQRKPITPTAVASLLRPYEIAPRTLRFGQETPKGYDRRWFDDAFSRYLQPHQTATPQHGNDFNGLHQNQTATSGDHVAVVNLHKSLKNNGCCGVAVGNPPTGADDEWDTDL